MSGISLGLKLVKILKSAKIAKIALATFCNNCKTSYGSVEIVRNSLYRPCALELEVEKKFHIYFLSKSNKEPIVPAFFSLFYHIVQTFTGYMVAILH